MAAERRGKEGESQRRERGGVVVGWASREGGEKEEGWQAWISGTWFQGTGQSLWLSGVILSHWVKCPGDLEPGLPHTLAKASLAVRALPSNQTWAWLMCHVQRRKLREESSGRKSQRSSLCTRRQALLGSQGPEYLEAGGFFLSVFQSSVSLQIKQIESVGHGERE